MPRRNYTRHRPRPAWRSFDPPTFTALLKELRRHRTYTPEDHHA